MCHRQHCVILLDLCGVTKTYTCNSAQARVKYLTLVYSQLESKKVPNTDELKSFRKYSVLLVPLGIEKEPQNDDELLDAISCVLEALKVIRFTKQAKLFTHVQHI